MKDKMSFQENIKRFALKATAAAIVTLNAEIGQADSCPPYISGVIADVCEFDMGSSVTVNDDGAVGGITMLNYHPGSPSYLAIDAGGMVSNQTGINITRSSLSNGISNAGTIISNDSGIAISSTSTIYGGISNSGAISSTNGTGIRLAGACLVSEGLSNRGTIQASNDFVGIAILTGSTITGGISNSGLIEANNGNAINIRNTTSIYGGISNSSSGVMSSTLQTGLEVFNHSDIYGDIFNQGIISGGNAGLSIHNASSVDGSISNQGTISGGGNGISIFSTTIISGGISNQGTISGEQNGISISWSATVVDGIANQGTISSGQNGISISSNATVGGISNSGVIQGDINAINISSNSNVSVINILGERARIIGAVDAPNTAVNITDGATFTSEGTYQVATFNIGAGALFNMGHRIRALTVNNSGTLAIPATLQTIDGGYMQQTGGLFQTNVSSALVYGQLSVTGAVDLAQSGDIYVQVAQNALLHRGDVLYDVISGSSLDAPAQGFNVSDNSYIWDFIPTLNEANNGLNLTATINPDAYGICRGTYCQGAAAAILEQVATGNPLFNPYATLSSANALREAASQATPELTNENIQVVQLITRSVLDVVPMWSTLRGRSSGDAMLYPPGKIWVKPYGASMTQNVHSTVQGFNATAYGAVIGKDILLANDELLGGGFAAGGDTMQGKSVLSGQSINSQAYQGIVYGAKRFPNHTYFAGQGLVGYEMNNTLRSIPLYASTAKGAYTSWFTNIRAEAGATYAWSSNFIFTPELDASYLFINQGHYQESGSPMDLLVASNHNSSLVLGAYGNGAYHLTPMLNQHHLTLTGYVGIADDVMNNQPHVNSTFVAGGSSFSTYGVQFNGAVFRGGAGLTLTNPVSPLVIEFNYDLQVGNNAYSGVGAATIKYKT